MPILRQMLGRSPDVPKARVRNFIANARLGTETMTIHENVISPGVVLIVESPSTVPEEMPSDREREPR